jgi:hypothetical protein
MSLYPTKCLGKNCRNRMSLPGTNLQINYQRITHFHRESYPLPHSWGETSRCWSTNSILHRTLYSSLAVYWKASHRQRYQTCASVSRPTSAHLHWENSSESSGGLSRQNSGEDCGSTSSINSLKNCRENCHHSSHCLTNCYSPSNSLSSSFYRNSSTWSCGASNWETSNKHPSIRKTSGG